MGPVWKWPNGAAWEGRRHGGIKPHMTLPVVWSDDCLLHVPVGDVGGCDGSGDRSVRANRGHTGRPCRRGHQYVPATAHGHNSVQAVHDAALLDFLKHG